MCKSENILAFEAALKEDKALREKFEAAGKRIAENKEAADHAELLVKAAAEVGFTLTAAEVDCVIAQAEELNDEDLEKVSGGEFNWCWWDYNCAILWNASGPNWA